MCRASNSKQDLRSPGENHSRGFSLHILRHRIIIRALREWTPSPASVLANSALDQRPDNLGGGPCRGLSRNGVKNYSKGPCVTILE